MSTKRAQLRTELKKQFKKLRKSDPRLKRMSFADYFKFYKVSKRLEVEQAKFNAQHNAFNESDEQELDMDSFMVETEDENTEAEQSE